MDPKEMWDWGFKGVMVLGWVVSATTIYNRLVEKVNGLGGRVKELEEATASSSGNAGRLEREVNDYRHDAQLVVAALGRMEKASEGIGEEIKQNALQIGSKLYEIERLINEKDTKTRERLMRLETVIQIEKKIGPIPTD